LGVKFVKGDKLDVFTVADEADVKGNLKSVYDAKVQADWVLVSHHNHYIDACDRDLPPKYMQPFAKTCLDRGADAYIGHGPHMLQGIEIYNGKPIFYSLGNFISQEDLISNVPTDVYENLGLGPEATAQDTVDARVVKFRHTLPKNFAVRMLEEPRLSQSVVALCQFRGHELVNLKLYPVDLGLGKPRHQYGTPMLADKEKGQAIIERVAKLSEPYGTEISYEGGAGIVSLS
jgi:poly-gamma-glutamate synthesis protein (capsule biosynthesis protein)